jgi:hypothetical protein
VVWGGGYMNFLVKHGWSGFSNSNSKVPNSNSIVCKLKTQIQFQTDQTPLKLKTIFLQTQNSAPNSKLNLQTQN